MISLTIIEGDDSHLDGFPETVTFEADVPSTIYYTLDGSDPTEDSLIAIGKIFLPTLSGTLEVKAIAVSGDDSSDITTVKYENSSLDLGGPRILGEEGIVVMRYGAEAVDNLGYTSDGEDAQKTSIEVGELDIKSSKTNSRGEAFSDGKTSREFINFPARSKDLNPDVVSTPNDNINFDPSARVILIIWWTWPLDGSPFGRIAARSFTFTIGFLALSTSILSLFRFSFALTVLPT